MKGSNTVLPPRRILIWTASFPPVLGGLQTVTRQLAAGFHDREHDVLVLTNRPFHRLPALENSPDGYTVRRCKHWQTGMNPQSPRNLISSLAGTVLFPYQHCRIAHLIGSFEPDVVNVHFPNVQNCYAAKLWPLLKHARWVVSLHGHDILHWYETNRDDFTYSRLRPLSSFEAVQFGRQQWLLERSDSVTACSAWLAEKAIRLFPFVEPKIKVIHNGVDVKRFKAVAGTALEPYIFAFGRLDTHKGFDLLIKAFASLMKSFPGLSLSIAGTGPAKDSLNRLAVEQQVDKRIKWLGHLSQEAIAAHCLEAALIVIPSRRETFGISVLEALASGRPVVATNVGGIPEIAEYFELELCSPNDKSIESTIRKLLIAKPGINYHYNPEILQKFNLKSMIDNYINVIVSA